MRQLENNLMKTEKYKLIIFLKKIFLIKHLICHVYIYYFMYKKIYLLFSWKWDSAWR